MVLSSCAHIDGEYVRSGIHTDELAEIRVALRAITSSPLKEWSRLDTYAANEAFLTTADRRTYWATKTRGKWHIEEVTFFT
jgi:hypothetical protein